MSFEACQMAHTPKKKLELEVADLRRQLYQELTRANGYIKTSEVNGLEAERFKRLAQQLTAQLKEQREKCTCRGPIA